MPEKVRCFCNPLITIANGAWKPCYLRLQLIRALRRGKIYSRIGLNADAILFDDKVNLFTFTKTYLSTHPLMNCVLIDEAQFLNKQQVMQLTDIVDELNIPVLAFGIRSDFKAEAFIGSLYLLIWADNIQEIKTICYCGKKAIMNLRIDQEGNAIKEGAQIAIGGNESYTAVCRKHFKQRLKKS